MQRPMPSRSLLTSCSAQVVLGRPRERFQPGPDALPQRAPIAVQSASWAGIPLHASNMPKEGKSPSSDSRFDVHKACAVLHLQVCYVIDPADSDNASQAAHVKRLQTIDIGLEQGPCFSAVQEHR